MLKYKRNTISWRRSIFCWNNTKRNYDTYDV